MTPAVAFAALGDRIDAAQAGQSAMQAKAQLVRTAGNYTVHEIQMSSGTIVREYVSSDGMIFAVAWEGPSLPDVKDLLGKYFDRYVNAMRGKPPAQRHASLRQADVVIQSYGRMGGFFGQAYLPQSLPQGVTPDVLQ